MSDDLFRAPLSRRSVLIGGAAATALAGAATLMADAPPAHAGTAADFAKVRAQWRSTLIGDVNLGDSVVQQYVTDSAQTAQVFWSSLNKAAVRSYLWADLTGASDAILNNTAGRMRILALALYTPGSTLYGNAQLRADLFSALDWFLTYKYGTTTSTTGNWWYWQIGIPLALNDICVLTHAEMAPSMRSRAMAAIIRHAPDPEVTGGQRSTGANRNWACAIAIVRGALIEDGNVISAAKNAVADIFPYTTSGDGFYADGGYVQHYFFSYNGGYGISLLQYLTYSMVACLGTPWQFTAPRVATVYEWVRHHYAPWIYGGGFMDMTRGRGLSRFYETDHRMGRLTIATLLQLAAVMPATEAKALRSLCKGWIQADTFLPFFAFDPAPIEKVRISSIAAGRAVMADSGIPAMTQDDLTMVSTSMARAVHRRPGFAYAIAMSTNRIKPYESVNLENAKGWYTGEGAVYVYLPGSPGHWPNQYWPTANMYRIAGTTLDTRTLNLHSQRRSLNTWAGGAVLGADAAVGMSLKFEHQTLIGRKSWFCSGDMIVCLGAGISSSDGNRIETIIEQRNTGPNGQTQPIINDAPALTSPSGTPANYHAYWAWIPNTGGYVFPGAANIKALREDRSGRWTDIDRRGSYDDTTLYTRRYITFWFDHGVNPSDASYAYLQLPGASRELTQQVAQNPDLDIVANTSKVQAVVRPERHVILANFWTADAPKTAGIALSDRGSIVLSRQGDDLKVAVSDPTRKLDTLTVTLDRTASAIIATDPGVQVLSTTPQISFSVNLSGHTGDTFVAHFRQA